MRKLLSKLISVFICIGVIVWLVMGSVTASFSDMAVSQNNNFTAGILDLRTNDVSGVTQTLYNLALIPGETMATQTITLKNAGNMNGSSLNISLSYGTGTGPGNDGTKPPGGSGSKTADEIAQQITLTALTYNGANLVAPGTTLYTAANTNFGTLAGIAKNGGTSTFTIGVQLNSGLGTTFEAEGLNLTMSFTLNQ